MSPGTTGSEEKRRACLIGSQALEPTLIMLDSLPVELVVEIFLRCMPPSPSVSEVDRIDLCAPRYAPLLLTQICSSWRNIALSTPILWSRFNVACNLANRRRHVAQLADLWLSRSGDCLLEVQLAGAMFEVASAESFVATLAQHASHIAVLALWVDNVALGRIDELRMTFSAIQELRLLSKRNGTHAATGIEEVWSASVAQSLASASTLCRLVLWGVPLSCFDLPSTHITSFCARQEDFNQVAHALQNLPNLVSLEAHLHLREADPQSESLPCTHGKLRSLSLEETRDGWLAEFQSSSALTRLTLPSLEELHWSCPDEDSSALDPFLDRSSVCLRKLHLYPMAIWAPGVDLPGTAVFKKPTLAGLQELGISSPKTDDFNRFCDVLGSDSTFLHELRRLIVSFPASRFRQGQNGTQDAPDPHAAIQHLAPAIRSRMALARGKPWTLRSLNINWGHSWDRQGAVSFFESAPELVEPFRALRTQGADVYVGGTSGNLRRTHSSHIFCKNTITIHPRVPLAQSRLSPPSNLAFCARISPCFQPSKTLRNLREASWNSDIKGKARLACDVPNGGLFPDASRRPRANNDAPNRSRVRVILAWPRYIKLRKARLGLTIRRRFPSTPPRPTSVDSFSLEPTTMSSVYSYSDDNKDILPGDIVAVTHNSVRREGLVVGAHIDYAGRQILEVQMDAGEVYNAWYPSVTRVRRTVSYARPSLGRSRTVERRIYCTSAHERMDIVEPAGRAGFSVKGKFQSGPRILDGLSARVYFPSPRALCMSRTLLHLLSSRLVVLVIIHTITIAIRIPMTIHHVFTIRISFAQSRA
uniref:F-box domain-containing protein n=1 Tax=Mycena chlorophos TaxID=658473 RepID=A0ABQ0M6V5_MYCCL|nr:predicted protein [Mycena chlorophos]